MKSNHPPGVTESMIAVNWPADERDEVMDWVSSQNLTNRQIVSAIMCYCGLKNLCVKGPIPQAKY